MLQGGQDLRVVVRFNGVAGQAQLQSTIGSDSSQAAWTTHIHASLAELTSAVPSPMSLERPLSVGLPARECVATLGISKPAAGVVGGVLAYLRPAAHMGTGYHLHPAIGDSLVHSGGLNPAGPLDGLTRVPVALNAYIANFGQSCGQMQRCDGMWAGVDTGSVTNDGSRFNTFRCTF